MTSPSHFFAKKCMNNESAPCGGFVVAFSVLAVSPPSSIPIQMLSN